MTRLLLRAAWLSVALFAPILAQPAAAQDDRFSFGGDEFSGGNSNTVVGAANDIFSAGNDVQITGDVAGDVHAIGNNLTVSGDVNGAIYAGGNNVNINGRVADDATLAGNNVTMSGAIGGNVRATGSTVRIDTPVSGSVLVAAEHLQLNGGVSGDLRFTGNRISFGSNAKVDGTVFIRSSQDVQVPASVAASSQVTIEKSDPATLTSEAGHIARDSMRGFWPPLLGGLGFFVFLLAIGVAWLALTRKRSELSYEVFKRKPFKSIGLGALSLAAFFGLVVVLAFTLIGLPLVPIAILLIVLVWMLGSVAGAYFLTRRIAEAFGQNFDSLALRILALALGLVVLFFLGWIPIVGWLLGLIVLFLGLGGIAMATMHRWTQSPLHAEMQETIV